MCLEQILALAHPFVPFISEELYHELPGAKEKFLAGAAYPESDEKWLDSTSVQQFEGFKDIVLQVRQLRAAYTISPGEKLTLFAKNSNINSTLIKQQTPGLLRIARLKEICWVDSLPEELGAQIVTDSFEGKVPLGDVIDIDAEMERLNGKIDKLNKEISKLDKKLGNEQFVSRAPKEVIEEKRQELQAFKTEEESLLLAREALTSG